MLQFKKTLSVFIVLTLIGPATSSLQSLSGDDGVENLDVPGAVNFFIRKYGPSSTDQLSQSSTMQILISNEKAFLHQSLQEIDSPKRPLIIKSVGTFRRFFSGKEVDNNQALFLMRLRWIIECLGEIDSEYMTGYLALLNNDIPKVNLHKTCGILQTLSSQGSVEQARYLIKTVKKHFNLYQVASVLKCLGSLPKDKRIIVSRFVGPLTAYFRVGEIPTLLYDKTQNRDDCLRFTSMIIEVFGKMHVDQRQGYFDILSDVIPTPIDAERTYDILCLFTKEERLKNARILKRKLKRKIAKQSLVNECDIWVALYNIPPPGYY